MTIVTIRMTSTPMDTLNSVCARNNIPYLHVQLNLIGRYGTEKQYVDTMLTPNRLAIVESLSTLDAYFESLASQKALWAVVVRGSELEASEHKLPYCSEIYKSWLTDSLVASAAPITKYPKKRAQANKNNSYLSQVLTDLYRVKPKEARPFTAVFSYLAGKKPFPKGLPPYLVRSLTAAEPIRTAVLDLKGNYAIVSVRAVAKKHKMDVFDINYTLARTGLLPNKKDKT